MRIIATAIVISCSSIAAASAASCDRKCLKEVTQSYVNALIAHAPAKAPLAKNFRSTENAVEVAPGQGLWKTASALGKFQRIYMDPAQSQAAFFGLIEENAVPAIVSLRLKVADKKISEAEAIVGRKGVSLYEPQTLIDHGPSDRLLAKGLRSSRKDMIAAANSYFDGAQSQNPAIVLQKPGCDRYENGVKTTHRAASAPTPGAAEQDCAGSLANMKQISAVVDRRFIVVDEEAGVVAATAIFNRPPSAKRNDGTLWPRLLFTEFFPIEKGRFTAIYAAMFYLPAEAKDAGWQAPPAASH